jgi:hypothetical protein
MAARVALGCAILFPEGCSEMTPFEQHLQALADLWNQGGKAYLTAQQSMFTGMADTMAKASSVGDKAPRGWFLATNEVDQTLQRMAEGRRLADLWNVERKFIAVFNAWVALRRHSLEHNKVMLEAWMRAAGAFAKMLNERANEGKALESWRAVLTLWVETANEVLLETQRSEAFLTTQRDLIKASSELRLAQQELAAFYSEMFGYPTRTELDDVHRTVTELRRELRAFKRESRAPRTAAESANGAARKAPRRAAVAQPRRRGAKPAQIGASS